MPLANSMEKPAVSDLVEFHSEFACSHSTKLQQFFCHLKDLAPFNKDYFLRIARASKSTIVGLLEKIDQQIKHHDLLDSANKQGFAKTVEREFVIMFNLNSEED